MLRIGTLSLVVALAGSTALAQSTSGGGTSLADRVRDLEKKRAKAPQEQAAKMEARSFQWVKVNGQKLQPKVARLLKELTWHKDLKAAQAESKRTGKPILWVHALGDIDGFL